jgi:glycogen(starch) synthase
MLSWEYPPTVVGGLGRHVQGLSSALAAAGHDVTVLTRWVPGAADRERVGEVRVVRVPAGPSLPGSATDTVQRWAAVLDNTLTSNAFSAVGGERFDVVHAHDWLVAPTAIALTAGLGAALVATVHTTEMGRPRRHLPAALDLAVHAAEVRLGHEARRVVVCSRYMRRQVIDLLGLPDDRVVVVVPDGVDPAIWQVPAPQVAAARLRFAGVGPLIGYAGRLVPEKGLSDLLAAMPRLRQRNPGLRAVIAGDGPSRAHLRRQARLYRLERAVSFTGFLEQTELATVLAATDAVVLPSAYEPSGMVALEAAAAGAPLAVASAGGLVELVESGVTAVTFPPGDPDGLAEAVDQLLADATFAHRLAVRARRRVAVGYTWTAVAARIGEVYAAALDPFRPAAGEATVNVPAPRHDPTRTSDDVLALDPVQRTFA